MGQAADIALVTQKDSQQSDNDAAEPREAEAAQSTGQTSHAVNEQASLDGEAVDTAAETGAVQADADAAGIPTVVPTPADDPAGATEAGVSDVENSAHDGVADGAATFDSPDDEMEQPHREVIDTVTVVVVPAATDVDSGAEANTCDGLVAGDETGRTSDSGTNALVAETPATDIVAGESDPDPVATAGIESDSVAMVEDWPSQAVAWHAAPAPPEVAKDGVDPGEVQTEAEPATDGDAVQDVFGNSDATESVSEADSQIIVRTAWERPPPLVTHPSWVVRDVAPEIVSSPSEPLTNPRDEDASHRDSDIDASSEVVGDPPQTDTLGDAAHAAVADGAHAGRMDTPAEVDFSGWRNEVVASRSQGSAWQAFDEPSPAGVDDSPDESDADVEDDRAASQDLHPPLQPVEPLHASSEASALAGVPQAAFRELPVAEPQLPWPAANAQSLHVSATDAVGYDDVPASHWENAKALGRTAVRYAAYAVGGYFALVFVLILLYRVINPPFSSLMAVQALTGTDVQQEWVPLDEISPALVRAVIVSEDWSFCEHYGIDIKAIEDAIERSGNGIPRGASTISMQTTKNLFLWNAKSYVRKAVELPLTLMIELIWPKSRILEVYLNVAEWGPGIFGAEAAAQYHFNKPASRLGEREAAQLAASLPNPIIREAGDPGPRTARKATVIQSRMRNAGGAANCVLGGR